MSHPRLDCPQARQHLTLFAGQDLDFELQGAVEQHLAGCESCGRELEAMRACRDHIGVLGAHTARAVEAVDLWPALVSSLRQEAATEPARSAEAPRPRAPRSGRRRTWIPASLAAAALLLLGLRIGLPGEEGPRPGPAAGGPSADVAATPPTNSSGAQGVAAAGQEATAAGAPPSGTLRRAGPADERLRDSSTPFGLQRVPWSSDSLLGRPGTAGGAPHTLASDLELR